MDAKPIRVHLALDVCDPAYMDALTDPLDLANALQRRIIKLASPDAPSQLADADRLTAIERRLDELAPVVYMSDVHAPRPSRLTEIELEQERLGDAVNDLQDALSSALQQHAALVARVCGLAAMNEGDHR